MPKKRANGEGSIRKRKDGRWEGRYEIPLDYFPIFVYTAYEETYVSAF